MLKTILSNFIFTVSIVCYCTAFSQDEIYQPIQIQDTIRKTTDAEFDVKSDNKKNNDIKDDARTELDKKKALLQRIRVGVGNIGLQFGPVTYVSIAPTVGYMAIKDRLEVGIGPILIYQRIKYSNNFVQSFFVYGASIYTRGYVFRGLFLQARYDVVNKPSNVDLNRRLNVHHILLGAGYTQAMGKVGFFNASILFNVLRNNESIYRGTFGDNFPLLLDFGFSFNVVKQ